MNLSSLWPFVLRSNYDRDLAEKEEVISRMAATSNDFDIQISRMADTIRAMDQLIFQMGQCISWDQMRPHFQCLQVMTEARMRSESDRIRNLMLPELKKTYTNPTPMDPLGKGTYIGPDGA